MVTEDAKEEGFFSSQNEQISSVLVCTIIDKLGSDQVSSLHENDSGLLLSEDIITNLKDRIHTPPRLHEIPTDWRSIDLCNIFEKRGDCDVNRKGQLMNVADTDSNNCTDHNANISDYTTSSNANRDENRNTTFTTRPITDDNELDDNIDTLYDNISNNNNHITDTNTTADTNNTDTYKALSDQFTTPSFDNIDESVVDTTVYHIHRTESRSIFSTTNNSREEYQSYQLNFSNKRPRRMTKEEKLIMIYQLKSKKNEYSKNIERLLQPTTPKQSTQSTQLEDSISTTTATLEVQTEQNQVCRPSDLTTLTPPTTTAGIITAGSHNHTVSAVATVTTPIKIDRRTREFRQLHRDKDSHTTVNQLVPVHTSTLGTAATPTDVAVADNIEGATVSCDNRVHTRSAENITHTTAGYKTRSVISHVKAAELKPNDKRSHANDARKHHCVRCEDIS